MYVIRKNNLATRIRSNQSEVEQKLTMRWPHVFPALFLSLDAVGGILLFALMHELSLARWNVFHVFCYSFLTFVTVI